MRADKRDPAQWPHKVELRFPDRGSYQRMLLWGIQQFGLPDGDSETSRWTFTTVFDYGCAAFMVVWFRGNDDAMHIILTWADATIDNRQ
jgi:hypothetical protein